MKTKTMDERRIERLVATAKDSLKDHVIRSEGERFVEIGAPGDCNMQCMLAFGLGHLAVFGDNNPVVFAYYNDSGGITGAIRWMSCDNLSYVRKKATIGMTHLGTKVFDLEIARAEADDHAAEALREGSRLVAARWTEIAKRLRNNDEWTEQQAHEMAYGVLGDSELFDDLGIVVSERVVWAWMLVRKANELLRLRDAERGGPGATSA